MCDSKQQAADARSEQLVALQQESTALLQSSDMLLLVKTGGLKFAAQQMADRLQSDSDPAELKLHSAGSLQLSKSVAALHKAALAIPFERIPLSSDILPDRACIADLQSMMGDAMKLVSGARRVPTRARDAARSVRGLASLVQLSPLATASVSFTSRMMPSCCIDREARATDGRTKIGQPNVSARATHSRSSRSVSDGQKFDALNLRRRSSPAQ